MIGYRDMTFCGYHEDCHLKSTCFRALTEQVQKDAEAWWGGPGPPISIFMEKPDCWRDETSATSKRREVE